MKKATTTIFVNDVEFMVEYGYTEYRPATHLEPPEYPEIELLSVMLDGTEVMELLAPFVLDEIINKIETPDSSEELACVEERKWEERRDMLLFKD